MVRAPRVAALIFVNWGLSKNMRFSARRKKSSRREIFTRRRAARQVPSTTLAQRYGVYPHRTTRDSDCTRRSNDTSSSRGRNRPRLELVKPLDSLQPALVARLHSAIRRPLRPFRFRSLNMRARGRFFVLYGRRVLRRSLARGPEDEHA